MDDDEDADFRPDPVLHSAHARGSRVELTGLASHASLNGRMATVLEYVPAASRWAIVTDPPNAKGLRVKPENIKLIHDPAMARNPISLTSLRQLEPAEHHGNLRVGTEIINKRIAQRKALVKVLRLATGHNAADALLNDPTCQILELSALNAMTVQPRQLYAWALVCCSWAAAVKAWLASTAAYPFWQRVCAGMLPPEAVLHPELCTKDMLREWAALPMAVGTKPQWFNCGLGMAQSEEESAAMTELELGVALAQLFKLWWNVGDDSETSPRFVGWMRLYFQPYLNGRTHETEERPGVHHLNQAHGGPMPMSLLANVCDCIQDFRMCPNCPNLPDIINDECSRTLRALIAKFHCQTPLGTQWRLMRAPQITPAKNATFHSILKRYSPLFPQQADTEPRVAVSPVFKRGRRHRVQMPRPECWRLWPHTANMFLIIDKRNTVGNGYYDHWEWDDDVMNHDEQGVIAGEFVVESEEEGEDEEEEDFEGEDEGEEEEEEEEEDDDDDDEEDLEGEEEEEDDDDDDDDDDEEEEEEEEEDGSVEGQAQGVQAMNLS